MQAAILPITDAQHAYTAEIHGRFREAGIRDELDDRNEKIGFKIREWELKKVPFMVIIGEKERASGSLSVRQRRKGDLGQVGVDDFLSRLVADIASRTLTIQEN